MLSVSEIQRYEKKRMKSRRVDAEWTGNKMVLQCDGCGGVWVPLVQKDGRFARRHWVCPHGRCNDREVQQ